LRSKDAFTLRRCQILLASDQGHKPSQSAAAVGCSSQAVRDALHAFAQRGLDCLRARPPLPKRPRAAWPKERDEDLKDPLHHSPPLFGQPTSLWTLDGAAKVCHAKGWTERVLTGEAIRQVLRRLKVSWQRAKHWISSPDPAYAAKKNGGTS